MVTSTGPSFLYVTPPAMPSGLISPSQKYSFWVHMGIVSLPNQANALKFSYLGFWYLYFTYIRSMPIESLESPAVPPSLLLLLPRITCGEFAPVVSPEGTRAPPP